MIINLSEIEERAEKPETGKPSVHKFVVLSVSGRDRLVCGLVSEYAYHADLVDRFCTDQGIATAWVRKPALLEIFDANVQLKGGGWMKVSEAAGKLEISGRSTAYGRFDSEAVREIIAADPYFKTYDLRIRG